MNSGVGIIVLGVVALVAGAAMVALQYHHTIGLGGIGLGVILLVVGVVTTVRGRKVPDVKDTTTTKPS